jgi:uncharacterized protein YbcC (UPF0753/DUF2309 family)
MSTTTEDQNTICRILEDVASVVAPVWPLRDYVAVNPYGGLSDLGFLDARTFLKSISDSETLLPLSYYAKLFQDGKLTTSDLSQAYAEFHANGIAPAETVQQLVDRLNAVGSVDSHATIPAAAPRTIAESISEQTYTDWSEIIVGEISKHCAAHYDEGQAKWSSPFRMESLYDAWLSKVRHDRNIEILGLQKFRAFIATLPIEPEQAILELLSQLEVPREHWTQFLLCQAFSVTGWSSWTKYQSAWSRNAANHETDFVGLLAMRLAYDVALARQFPDVVDEEILMRSDEMISSTISSGGDTTLRYLLLRATEVQFRDSVLRKLSHAEDSASATASPPTPKSNGQPLAQVVFCIDVRSERIRRHLERSSERIETFGFAGFFGMPIEYLTLGDSSGDAHLPVLLKPQFQMHEGLRDGESVSEAMAIQSRAGIRTWRSLWKAFQTSAVGGFSFVESLGLLFGVKLFGKTVPRASQNQNKRFDGVPVEHRSELGPTLRGLNEQGITPSAQVDLAEGLLRNLGLTSNFAKFVVFCGHASQTENNLLAAGLDCGACGGHSGEPNARLAALLLNQTHIREALAERGIAIPAETRFVGGLHNTTTDELKFFDTDELVKTDAVELNTFIGYCNSASRATRSERLPLLAGQSSDDLLVRAKDWSEVRPEWGLAGNAAFIVGPRSLTKDASFDGRTFLHSYDFQNDPKGQVLETIMTAPMVVAHWISMQYYASSVDNTRFGSGTKTVHNAVGRFGIVSGNGGDLRTGLPLQSLHTGKDFQHLPLRLQSIIAAPRQSIENVITNHPMLQDLLTNSWLHLIALDSGIAYRYTEKRVWEAIELPSS